LSEPINPIPSDAFFITKRSTFLNDNNLFNHIPVILSNFRKLHRIDLRNNKIYILTQVEIEDIENLNKNIYSRKLHLFLNGSPIL
jgi:hypothetical protein